MTTPETTPPQPLTPTEPAATETYRPNDAASELVKVLDQYLADLQAGRAPDRAQLLAAHPELGSQLESCLAGIEFIHRAAQPSSGAPTRLGDFRIVREIGRGGMGVVYEAEQLSLKRRVALKVLRFGAVADAEVLQRFQREAQTVAHLHHTNIVPIFAVGCEQGVHYYAMQFIEGRSLAAVLTEAQLASRPLAAKEVARWGLQAAEALAYAHQRGVIHRDIKPSNLLLDPEGTLWLTDFGLAKRADEVTLTLAGTLMGTPRYMSPEQAAAMEQPVDHRTDIYSLGASLYELATSKPVFEAESPHAVLTQIRSAEPVAPRRWTRGLPRDLETIILKCLAKEPARRYATAQALADDLRAFLDGRGIKARRASLVERSRRWARRHPRSVTAAVTGVAAALLIVGGFFGWNWYQEARLGSLTLTTDGPPLVAEILDDQEAQVLPAFTVPTQQPVRVRAGNYRVRLSGQDQLSEDYHVCIPRNSLTVGHVSLGERQLWEPIDIKRDESFEAVDLAGHADVLIAGQDHLRCLDGATAKPLWDTAAEGHGLQLVRPAADLNGDGVPDLVWASQRWPSLMAVSGKDGKVLWQHQARPNMPKTGQVIDSRDVIDSRVLGQPILAEVEGQGRLDVLATFSWYGNLQEPGKAAINLRVATWVEAISGRTGQMLWRRDLVPMSPTPGPPNMDASIAAAQVTRLGGKPVVAVVCDNHLAVLDLKSGEPVAPLRDLPFQPGAGITFGDFNGPRRPNPGIQFGNFNGPGVLLQSPDISTPKTLAAVSLQTGKPVWQM
ncbi:MAG: protein kinase, partial [Planctomycetes bacterium]|nr:protein kinase [Planctomycetota bacterium]